jgi:crotonobetainyl-CoA:carnitine CoA-transferase CaiB-like acyl-CoA transferase
MNEKDRPLSGYRVVDLSTYVAAPSCSRLLADWGADVIKVESVSGDAFRYFGPTMFTPAKDEENPLWDMLNSNKRGLALDLKSPEGKEIFHKLLSVADVFLTNTRPEALEKLSLDYESLKDKYPRLIYAYVTGYGEKGPDVDLPGFDVVAYWARSGFMVDLVKPDEYPMYSPAGFGDLTVGAALFGGICAALLNRQKTGKGDKISIALYGAAIWFSGIVITTVQERYGNKYPKTRLEGNPLAIPYRCNDGEWIMLSILEIDRYWPAFCKALGREDLLGQERFKGRQNLLDHRAELIPILEETFRSRDRDEWVRILTDADIVHAKMQHFRDTLNDEQARANGFVYETTFPNGEKALLPSTPLRSMETGPLPCQRGPWLGEHTREILNELGYSPDRLEELSKCKVIKVR